MVDLPRYVVDASVAVKWHLQDEEWVEQSLEVLADFRQGNIRLLSPSILCYELASALLKATRPMAGRNRFLVQKAEDSLTQFLSLGVELIEHTAITLTAFQIAARYGCSYYDAVYLATAQMTNTPLLYADGKLRRALGDRFPLAVWIGDYQRDLSSPLNLQD
ncbi:MAG: type II toxin-antitoxin system VapC family toxin [Dehalococcoidia bacterium]|nr:type II toxin-antitoxin system VapC family toxin [Dehalococcoidia bacterium]